MRKRASSSVGFFATDKDLRVSLLDQEIHEQADARTKHFI